MFSALGPLYSLSFTDCHKEFKKKCFQQRPGINSSLEQIFYLHHVLLVLHLPKTVGTFGSSSCFFTRVRQNRQNVCSRAKTTKVMQEQVLFYIHPTPTSTNIYGSGAWRSGSWPTSAHKTDCVRGTRPCENVCASFLLRDVRLIGIIFYRLCSGLIRNVGTCRWFEFEEEAVRGDEERSLSIQLRKCITEIFQAGENFMPTIPATFSKQSCIVWP